VKRRTGPSVSFEIVAAGVRCADSSALAAPCCIVWIRTPPKSGPKAVSMLRWVFWSASLLADRQTRWSASLDSRIGPMDCDAQSDQHVGRDTVGLAFERIISQLALDNRCSLGLAVACVRGVNRVSVSPRSLPWVTPTNGRNRRG
jgi:hypothetical protein